MGPVLERSPGARVPPQAGSVNGYGKVVMSNIQRTERMLDKTRWIFYQAKRE